MSQNVFEIAIILLLILLNGVFAMSEIAIVSARRLRLQQMVERGSKGAKVALELLGAPNRFLSTVQVGITLVGVFAGAFGGAALAADLAVPLAELPVVGRYANTISLFLVVGVITYLSVVVGELVPKRIALHSAERISALVSRPMRFLSVVATPVVRLLSVSTDAVVRLMGIEGARDDDVTEEEIRILVEQGAQAGIIEEAERDMVESVFRLGDRPLEAMMTPRTEIAWLDTNAPQEENRRIAQESSHSRFPVCDGDLDHVVGIVLAQDLLAGCLAGNPFDLSVMKEPLFVPETMRALHALERFKESGMSMALLVDEYGGIEGLVTLIDILEAIVGDIPTPEEMAAPPIVQREDGTWLVDGLLTLDEFREEFDVPNFPGEGRYQTIGGFVVFMLGELPQTGDTVEWEAYRFEIVDLDGHRVDKVLVQALD